VIVATAPNCASDRHVSPGLPSAQRSVFGLNAWLQPATLLMIPSFTPSSASHVAYTASVSSLTCGASIQPAPLFSYSALPTLNDPRCSIVTL
jgi:hypothetical protein